VLRADGKSFPVVLAAASALGLLLSSAEPAAAAGPRPARHTVVIDSMRFDPPVLTVKAGDTIVWINQDPFPHTVTAEKGQFDSHEIASGRSWKYTARKAGTFPYACALHPTMKATLHVE
jgi:plastocyanin